MSGWHLVSTLVLFFKIRSAERRGDGTGSPRSQRQHGPILDPRAVTDPLKSLVAEP